jgi:2-succinyl-5-enolpyruvyl-6-hydroxy-3-cyclohexene-1-carboxylate synthase
VCVNNGGGGIFDFLAVADHAETAAYEELVATPSGVDLERLAAGLDIPHTLAQTTEEVREALAAPGLIEVRTHRARNVEQHRELFALLAEELDGRVA